MIKSRCGAAEWSLFMYKPMRFWGTSAGATLPSPFCRCRSCENARKVGGKEVRLRSAFRIDRKTMIDIGQDYAAQAARLADEWFDVENFIITHTHSDHFNPLLLWVRWDAALVGPKKPITIYLTEDAYRTLDEFLYTTPALIDKNAEYMSEKSVIFKKLAFYETANIGGHRVTPLRGVHNTVFEKNSANYVIDLADGRRMYYALDSGYYSDETFEYLKGKHLDILIGECTFPGEYGMNYCPVHMNVTTTIATFDRLWENKTIDENTDIYLTHIGDNGMTHKELQAYFAELDRPYHVKIAYDGLSVDEAYEEA